MESFPPRAITPYGIKMLKDGVQPLITYTSPDGELIFYLNGGLSPFPGVTEGVILADGMDGLHPPLNHLDHKGARQNGVTWSDTVYDPGEMTMKVTCHGNSPQGLKRIIRKWIAAWDPKNPGTLSWVTPDMGQWTCVVRLAKNPPEKLERGYAQRKQQTFTWYVRNDGAFWVGPNSISQLGVSFEAASDDFKRDGLGSLGTNWMQTYSGEGAGACGAKNGEAVWGAVDPVTFFTGTQNFTFGPFRGFSTVDDTQLVRIVIANTPDFTLGTGAANHIWGRMGANPDGTWDGNGIRATIGWGFTRISAFVNFTEHVLTQQFSAIPPVKGDQWTLHCGAPGKPLHFALYRENVFAVASADDKNSVSQIGLNYRGVGFGMQAGGSILLQAAPAKVNEIWGNTTLLDNFSTETDRDLGANWPVYEIGSGTGFVKAESNVAVYVNTAEGRSVYNRWLGASEVQTVTLNGSPLTWNLTFLGKPGAGVSQATAALSGTATAAQVQSALEALAGINVGDVAVTGGSGTYQVAFTGGFATTPMYAMKATVLTGPTTSYATVARTTIGSSEFTSGDDQVVSVELGKLFQFPFPSAAYINVFGRMNTNDVSPTGMCLQIGPQWVALFVIHNGAWTRVAYQALAVAPFWNETWTLTCGTADNNLKFLVQRDGATVTSWTDKNGISSVGPSFRGTGFGMVAGDGILQQQIPPSVKKWSMGDNGGITQSGHLTLTNFGDQPAYPDYLVYGPGTFTFADGPGAEPTVVFGPLTEGQVALIRTDPGLRGVYDLSTSAATVTLEGYSEFAQQLTSLATNGNIEPLMEWFKSEFGVAPDQGNLYSLLQGRFSQPILATPTTVPTAQQIAVDITGAGVTTRVVGVVTPLRRWPE